MYIMKRICQLVLPCWVAVYEDTVSLNERKIYKSCLLVLSSILERNIWYGTNGIYVIYYISMIIVDL